MQRVLVCPFGNVNLLVTLCENLRIASHGHYAPTYLCFTRYEREIYRTHRLPHVYVPPGEAGKWLPEQMLDEAVRYTRALAERHLQDPLRGTLESAANHYAKRIACAMETGSFRDVLLFNGRHNLFVSVLDQVSDLLGCRKLVFEQGLFRPDYLTIDGVGVNARNSVDSLEGLLDPEPYAYQRRALYRDLVAQLPLAASQTYDYKRSVTALRLSLAYAATKLEPKWRLFLRSAENRDLLEAACLPGGKKVDQTRLLPVIDNSREYDYMILCPLQVETDTQVVLHSPWIKTMQALVDHVGAAVQVFNQGSTRKACVVFKTHPMETRPCAVHHPDAFLIHESTVPDILRQRCDLVITINSTAGIEAIEARKPVITLGDAFYNFTGIVHSHCSAAAQLPQQIAEGLEHPAIDLTLQQRFIDALKRKYQVPLQSRPEAPPQAPPLVMPVPRESSPVGV